jgi:hypothetical protein
MNKQIGNYNKLNAKFNIETMQQLRNGIIPAKVLFQNMFQKSAISFKHF